MAHGPPQITIICWANVGILSVVLLARRRQMTINVIMKFNNLSRQFYPNLAQSIRGLREFKFVQLNDHTHFHMEINRKIAKIH